MITMFSMQLISGIVLKARLGQKVGNLKTTFHLFGLASSLLHGVYSVDPYSCHDLISPGITYMVGDNMGLLILALIFVTAHKVCLITFNQIEKYHSRTTFRTPSRKPIVLFQICLVLWTLMFLAANGIDLLAAIRGEYWWRWLIYYSWAATFLASIFLVHWVGKDLERGLEPLFPDLIRVGSFWRFVSPKPPANSNDSRDSAIDSSSFSAALAVVPQMNRFRVLQRIAQIMLTVAVVMLGVYGTQVLKEDRDTTFPRCDFTFENDALIWLLCIALFLLLWYAWIPLTLSCWKKAPHKSDPNQVFPEATPNQIPTDPGINPANVERTHSGHENHFSNSNNYEYHTISLGGGKDKQEQENNNRNESTDEEYLGIFVDSKNGSQVSQVSKGSNESNKEGHSLDDNDLSERLLGLSHDNH